MEKTVENKFKLFAQYWGQEVLKYENSENDKYWNKQIYQVDSHNITCKHLQLSLRPLSSITDDEAIEVCKISYLATIGVLPIENNEQHIKTGKWLVSDTKLIPLNATDYLRSKGFALPYMGLSVEKQIEYGWIKLTPHPNGTK
jgi:hypothetical protein